MQFHFICFLPPFNLKIAWDGTTLKRLTVGRAVRPERSKGCLVRGSRDFPCGAGVKTARPNGMRGRYGQSQKQNAPEERAWIR